MCQQQTPPQHAKEQCIHKHIRPRGAYASSPAKDILQCSVWGRKEGEHLPGVNSCVHQRRELLCACLVTLLPHQDLHALEAT